MKSNPKTKIIILIILGITLCLSPIINNYLSFNAETSDINSYNENLKISKVSGPIYIDGNSAYYNWSYVKSTGICTGEGTYSDPYVIEDLVIDGGGSGSCIEIEDSSVYFRIENCTVYNFGYYGNDAGIRLNRVSNGSLITNNCSSNGYNGISLVHSDNNTVSGNTANDNGNGIFLSHSDNNTISGNIANNNERNGIELSDSNNITVLGNIMNERGLRISGSLEELRSHDINATNLVNEKPLYYYANEINLGPSDFTNAGQVILVNCDDSLISNLNISYTSTAISLFYCNNNVISRNTANNNYYNGISLDYSNYTTVSGNTVNNNSDGIALYYNSDNNNISGNTVNNNWYGIALYYDNDNNNISGNTANNNQEGIYLSPVSYNNIISENTASYNFGSGILLDGSRDNIVSGNTANNNYNGIYLSFLSRRNIITGNTINYNNDGIRLESSDDNTISGNTANNNTQYAGIVLVYCDNNDISGNSVNTNFFGIFLYRSHYNTVSGNVLIENSHCIIELECVGNVLENNRCGLGDEKFPLEMIITISSIAGGIGVAAVAILLLRKRKRISEVA